MTQVSLTTFNINYPFGRFVKPSTKHTGSPWATCTTPSPCKQRVLSDMPLGRRSPSLRHICTKVMLAEGRESPFTEHYRDFEKSYRVLQTEVQKLKDEVQEMHRDLTMHHSLINTDTMDSIFQMSLIIDQQIASLYSTIQTQRAVFEEVRI
ncbi:RING finger protein 207 [Triplophysa tibetana]|uniref:RING finger protein 207 n=1 Tax=Triplophysa tibetana TaxID=1572043 RepID=A0A5A9NE35_9TELE|nr:RING finger protein 207 [Triplophysa tibetana]